MSKILDHEYTIMIHDPDHLEKDDPGEIIPMHKTFMSLVNLSHSCPHCHDEVLEVLRCGEIHKRKVSEHVRQEHTVVLCATCHEHIGTACYQQSSLFGFDEDRHVLHGRPRVY